MATLTIPNNDTDESPFTLTLNGTANVPASYAAFESYLVNAGVPSNLSGMSDDADQDGVANLVEFALGLGVMTPDAGGMPAAQLGGGLLSLTYTRAQQVHVVYSVKTTTTLESAASWTAVGVNQGTPDAGGVTTASIPSDSAPARFLRLEVSLAP